MIARVTLDEKQIAQAIAAWAKQIKMHKLAGNVFVTIVTEAIGQGMGEAEVERASVYYDVELDEE